MSEQQTVDSQMITQWHKGTSSKVPDDNQPLQRTVQCPMTSLLAIYFNSKQSYSRLSSHFLWSLSVLDTFSFIHNTVIRAYILFCAFHLFGPLHCTLTHRNLDSLSHTHTDKYAPHTLKYWTVTDYDNYHPILRQMIVFFISTVRCRLTEWKGTVCSRLFIHPWNVFPQL